MGNGRCADAPLSAPRPAVENSSNRRHQNIAPVEAGCPLVPVCETKKDCGQHQRSHASDSTLEKILQPSAKEQLFRNRNEEKREDKGCNRTQRIGPRCVHVQKSQRQSKRNRDHSVKTKLAQPNTGIAACQSKVEAHSVESPYREEAIDARIQEQHLAERRETHRPCWLEPPQIHGQPQHSKNHKITPIATLASLGVSCLV